MDRWIVSRLSLAVEQCNEAFNTYNFPLATTACHAFWLYDFCDVYLVWFLEHRALYDCLSSLRNTVRRSCHQRAYTRRRVAVRCCTMSSTRHYASYRHSCHSYPKSCGSDCRTVRTEKSQSASLAILRVKRFELCFVCVNKAHFQLQHPWRDAVLDERVALAQEMYKAARSMRSFYNLQPKQRTKSEFSACN